jgi:hypothetical protein
MKRLLFVVVLLSICAGIRADEGMWTFDNVPRAEIKAIAGLPAAEVAAARNKVVTTLDSIAGSYWFDAEMNRSVAVHPQFIPDGAGASVSGACGGPGARPRDHAVSRCGVEGP